MNDQTAHSRVRGSLHVTELARLAGVTPATIRHYSRVGLLRPQREPNNGYRCFVESDIHRVVFVRRAQALGLTINDIKVILDASDEGQEPSGRVRALVEKRLAEVREQLGELQTVESRIRQALAAWADFDDTELRDGEICPLIDRVDLTRGSGAEPVAHNEQSGRKRA